MTIWIRTEPDAPALAAVERAVLLERPGFRGLFTDHMVAATAGRAPRRA